MHLVFLLLLNVSSIFGSQVLDLSKINPINTSNIFIKEDHNIISHPFGVKRARFDNGSTFPVETENQARPRSNPKTPDNAEISVQVFNNTGNRMISDTGLLQPISAVDNAPVEDSSISAGSLDGKSKPRARPASSMSIETNNTTTSYTVYSMALRIDKIDYPLFYFGPSTSHAELIDLDLNQLKILAFDRRQAMQKILDAISADDVDNFSILCRDFLVAFKIDSLGDLKRGGFKSYLTCFAFLFGAVKISERYEADLIGFEISPGLINLDCIKYLIVSKPPSVALATMMRFLPYLYHNDLLVSAMDFFTQRSPPLNYFQRICVDNYIYMNSSIGTLFADDSMTEIEIFSKISGAFFFSNYRMHDPAILKLDRNNYYSSLEGIFMKIFKERYNDFFGLCKDSVKIGFIKAIFASDDVELFREIHQKYGEVVDLIHINQLVTNLFIRNNRKKNDLSHNQGCRTNLLDIALKFDAKNCFRYLVKVSPELVTDVSKKEFSTLFYICHFNKPTFLDIIIEFNERYLDAVVFTDNTKSYDIIQYAFLKRIRKILEHLCRMRGADEIIGRLLMIWDSTDLIILHGLDGSYDFNCDSDLIKFTFELFKIECSQKVLTHLYFHRHEFIKLIRSKGLDYALETLANI